MLFGKYGFAIINIVMLIAKPNIIIINTFVFCQHLDIATFFTIKIE